LTGVDLFVGRVEPCWGGVLKIEAANKTVVMMMEEIIIMIII
jgi:hypothetical protein